MEITKYDAEAISGQKIILVAGDKQIFYILQSKYNEYRLTKTESIGSNGLISIGLNFNGRTIGVKADNPLVVRLISTSEDGKSFEDIVFKGKGQIKFVNVPHGEYFLKFEYKRSEPQPYKQPQQKVAKPVRHNGEVGAKRLPRERNTQRGLRDFREAEEARRRKFQGRYIGWRQ